MLLRCEVLSGSDLRAATTSVLQRARLADPRRGMWEAADLQWWSRRPRPSDAYALPVWFDQSGPVLAAGVTTWETSWQFDLHGFTANGDEVGRWPDALAAARALELPALELVVRSPDTTLIDCALGSGFTFTDDRSGTAWIGRADQPALEVVPGFELHSRLASPDGEHPMVRRNGAEVEQRLQDCSLYNPALDLCVRDAAGQVAGYTLFWFDPVTAVGLVEPVRVEDEFQRRGLARMLLTHGLQLLFDLGATEVKIGFESAAAQLLYERVGFVQTSVDRSLVLPLDAHPATG